MVRLKIIFLVCSIFIALVLVSCAESREDKIAKYLNSQNLDGDYSIGILNPNQCGSCTDFSILELCKRKTKGNEKIILTTGKLEEGYKKKLSENGYSFKSVDANNLARVGITLTVCTFIEMREGEIVQIDIIK